MGETIQIKCNKCRELQGFPSVFMVVKERDMTFTLSTENEHVVVTLENICINEDVSRFVNKYGVNGNGNVWTLEMTDIPTHLWLMDLVKLGAAMYAEMMVQPFINKMILCNLGSEKPVEETTKVPKQPVDETAETKDLTSDVSKDSIE